LGRKKKKKKLWGISPQNYPVINNRMEVRMVNRLQGVQPRKSEVVVTAKQTTLNFSIIISIKYVQITVRTQLCFIIRYYTTTCFGPYLAIIRLY
jgi:hypothetical protein